MKETLRRILITSALLGLGSVLMLAQTDRGTITGTVTDASGAVIVGAKVTATNTATGISTETSTSGAGVFTIPQLTVGVYRVAVEQSGFKRFVQEGLTVPLGQTVRVNASLQLGETSQSIEVQAEAPLLKPDTSELGTTISNQQIVDFPLSLTGEQRNPATFIRLVPGVVGRGSSSYSNPEATFQRRSMEARHSVTRSSWMEPQFWEVTSQVTFGFWVSQWMQCRSLRCTRTTSGRAGSNRRWSDKLYPEIGHE